MQATQNEIRRKFRRQVRLCSGIGRRDMLLAIEEARREGVFLFDPEPTGEATLASAPGRTANGLLEIHSDHFGMELYPRDEEAILRAICDRGLDKGEL